MQHRGTSVETIDRRIRLSIIPTLGDQLMHEVTRGDIQDAITEWSQLLAPQTARFTYQYLSTIFLEAEADGVIQKTPCKKIRLPPLEINGMHVLTPDQAHDIADLMEHRPPLREAAWVAYGTGARPGEWRAITKDRVNFDTGRIKIDRQLIGDKPRFGPTKTPQSDRTVTVGETTLSVLEDLARNASPDGLLLHKKGEPVKGSYLSWVWRDARKDNPFMGGKGTGWHLLRHAHASMLLSSGESVVAVSKRLGHKDATETLQTYAHVMPDDDTVLAATGDVLSQRIRHKTATDRPEGA